MTKLFKKTKDEIRQAAELLVKGGIIALPTETVYGLAGNACDEEAVKKIYAAKGRPSINPLIVHVQNLDHAKEFAIANETAEKLAKHFWPGPLTLVMKLKENHNIAASVTAGLDTIAVRMSSHPVFQDILKTSNLYLAAPSANKSENLSPTTPHHVLKTLQNRIDGIVDGGACEVGVESSIVDTTVMPPVLLRPGGIALEDLQNIIEITTSTSDDIKAPGQMLKHYSPSCPIRINAESFKQDEAALCFGETNRSENAINLSLAGDLEEAARNLFDHLHVLEEMVLKKNLKGIAVTPIPNIGLGVTINDRLIRAAYKKDI